jgi:hypothetical protein
LIRVQTDNSFFAEKIRLRYDELPQRNIRVLNAFGGDNRIWAEIKKNWKYDISVDSIDIKKKYQTYLKGDNIKFLQTLDLKQYDFIDLDAYGIPFKQLEIIFASKFKGNGKAVFVTFIQSMHGRLPVDFLKTLGYTNEMIAKVPNLLNKNGFEKFKNYLFLRGIKRIIYYQMDRKVYLKFNPA